ncbi:hypothetical protein [Rhodothermus marinus]|uniref:hypothetical protein n=1 Tax=Rhodothermus marinus TaxID=29549 RepID=UPI000A9A2FA3|nr:hypothetical protein [Rhodothermus marinus]
MEIPALQGMTIGQALLPMEKPLRLREQHRSLRIGVPREVANEERRVALAPSGVATLVANGHEVYVEQGAGVLANFPDAEYMEAGAQIVATPEDLYSQCELIVKVGRPTDDELKLLQENQVLISALHLGNTTPDFLRRLMELGVTVLALNLSVIRTAHCPSCA